MKRAVSRRAFVRSSLQVLGAATTAGCIAPGMATGRGRDFQVCLAPDAIERDPDLLPTVYAAGVRTVWLAGFFYGHWPWAPARIRAARERVEAAGMTAHLVNVPLGHPGDSLGAREGTFPLTPPEHWRLGHRLDGSRYAGTSLHAPATAENVRAVRELRSAGFRHFFLDDDFRVARGPGEIGGCYCGEHRERFLTSHGYAASRWDELLEAVRERCWTGLVREWVDFSGAELTSSFLAQEASVGKGRLGVMVMFLGAEKAGLQLERYRERPFRVGELMFDDTSFRPAKGKTDELFSALFHRQFASPELAWSETTAYPADRLSAAHLAAKLVVSTLADVRHTMFMSGVTPFPRAHWAALGPAMREQAQLHGQVAGHRPEGPLKLYWGDAARYVGDDRPFSLWLASGVPFEVTRTLASTGWTFLGAADAAAVVRGTLVSPGTRCIARPEVRGSPSLDPLDESLEAVFAWKAAHAAEFNGIPWVEEPSPAVCAWYPTARVVLVWNLADRRIGLTVRSGHRRHSIELPALGCGSVRL